jgi:hypothetical protein
VKAITILYILNATLLLLHEIESGYEREWELLGLPGKLAGFLVLHVPVILALAPQQLDLRLSAGDWDGVLAELRADLAAAVAAKENESEGRARVQIAQAQGLSASTVKKPLQRPRDTGPRPASRKPRSSWLPCPGPERRCLKS